MLKDNSSQIIMVFVKFQPVENRVCNRGGIKRIKFSFNRLNGVSMRRPPRDDYLNVKSNWEEIVIESLMRNAGNLVSRASIRKPLRRRVGKFEFAFAGMNAETFRFKHAETRQPNVLTFSPCCLFLSLSL